MLHDCTLMERNEKKILSVNRTDLEKKEVKDYEEVFSFFTANNYPLKF